jgi:Protein of unknown function (DUF2914)
VQTQGTTRKNSWALATILGGIALGCNDPREADQLIARETPVPLRLAAEGKPAGDAPPSTEAAPSGSNQEPSSGSVPLSPAPGEHRTKDGAETADASGAQYGVPRGRRRRPGTDVDEGRDTNGADRNAPGGATDGSAAYSPVLKVMRLVVARGIDGREPLGTAAEFSMAEVDRVFAFVELANEARITSEIAVTFTPPVGEAVQPIKLGVGTMKRWRTWAATRRARMPGLWSVEVLDAEGNVLARTSFTITK